MGIVPLPQRKMNFTVEFFTKKLCFSQGLSLGPKVVANYPSLRRMVRYWLEQWRQRRDELEINVESLESCYFRLLLSFHFQLSKLSSQFHCVACQFAIRNADFLKNVAQTEVLIVEQLFQAPKPVVMSSQKWEMKAFFLE